MCKNVCDNDHYSVHATDSADEVLDSASSSSDESNDSYQENLEDFESRLAKAFTTTNMTHLFFKSSGLMNVFQPFISALKTPVVSAPTTSVARGEYLHLGIKTALLRILQATDLKLIPDILQVDLNTDGASLDKNSKIVMWPIQIRIPNIPGSAAEVVGKPSSAKEFFKPSVDELLVLFEDGLEFCGSVKVVDFRCLIADGPARAFALDHRGHNSTARCSRCWIRGVMVYEGTVFVARTEEEYLSRVDILHYKGLECPISVLPINQMSSTVFDYMHLDCLGLIDGKLSKSAKLSSAEVQVLANRLEKVKEYCPDDFARKPVNVLKHGKFKATEHRQIQLYSGPVIFYALSSASCSNLAYNVTVLLILAAPDLQSAIYANNEYDGAIGPQLANKENLFEDSDTIVVEGRTMDEFENTQLIYQGYEENRGVYGIEEN
ncbi:hypothetical protein TSAR_007946 [Trichomalopsis sarcophagae]|uniref:Uncharacterized protein n=1 Tax=Trichomalopsis sarcophagae TaxID=543379 RepID=A0A232EQ82_9HYME|nr:hypothetical protein TSAR_007946 [Trichomalopsis sarcophagae]